MSIDEALDTSVTVGDISPTPTPDVIAAITVAVLEAWPKPPAVSTAVQPNLDWRFGQRRWHARTTPRRSWGL